MLHLVFQLDGARYAVDATRVRELLPLVHVTPVPHAPAGVLGLLDLRGTPVPVIDLTALLAGHSAEHRLSTRVVVVSYPTRSGEPRPLALVAERATATIRRAPEAFVESGLANPRTAYLGPVTNDSGGFIQRLDITRLLPPAVSDVLFA